MKLTAEQKTKVIDGLLNDGVIERASDILARQNNVTNVMRGLFDDLNMIFCDYKNTQNFANDVNALAMQKLTAMGLVG